MRLRRNPELKEGNALVTLGFGGRVDDAGLFERVAQEVVVVGLCEGQLKRR